MKKAIIVLIILPLLTIPVFTHSNAATITVALDYTGGFDNIQAAINAAIGGDTVIVKDGTYTGTGNHDIEFKGKQITVQSLNGPENCIISLKRYYENGFVLRNKETRQSVLKGFTIVDGTVGVHCTQQTSPTIANCIILRNGRGIDIGYESSPLIIDCIIRENTNREGAGIRSDYGNPEIVNCIIADNIADSVEEYKEILPGIGGGIFSYQGGLKIENCTIVGNMSQDGNSGGIALYHWNDSSSKPVVITNTIIWGNGCGNIHYEGQIQNHIVKYCNIEPPRQGTPDYTPQSIWDEQTNISADPQFAGPSAWDANDTPQDLYDDSLRVEDLHLKSQYGRWDTNAQKWQYDNVTSPCIDAGEPNSPRQNEPQPNGNRINIGAYGGTSQASRSPGPKTITVALDGTGEIDNIQAAIDAAQDGDTIVVANGTYTGSGNFDIDFKGKAITLQSQNGPENCIIDCQKNRRAFLFQNSEGNDTVLSGLTVRNGKHEGNPYAYGGAIYCVDASPNIENCIFANNLAEGKMAIPFYCEAGNAFGGAIYCDATSHPQVSGCTFVQNTALGGEGINYREMMEIYYYPSGMGIGGAIYAEGNITVRNCILRENSALTGKFMDESVYPPRLDDSFPEYGGAIRSGGGSIFNSIIADNIGTRAISGISEIVSCTVVYNQMLPCEWYRTRITNSIIWGNGENNFTNNSDITYSCIDQQVSGIGNIHVPPLFYEPDIAQAGINDLSPGIDVGVFRLKSKHGRWDTTLQQWVYDDITSPCIDAGDPDSNWQNELYPHGQRSNMGAYANTPQASMSPSTAGNIADLNHDDMVTIQDFAALANKWQLNKPLQLADFDRNGKVDIQDLVILSQNWLKY